VVNKLREAKNVFFCNLKPNSKDFWKALKCLNCDTSSVPTLHKNGTTANSNSEKATLIGQCFSQHFNLSEPPLTPDDLPETDPSLCPSYLLCAEEEVLLMLGSLDVSKSNGPDGISARMLKSTSHSIAPAITKLFNMSIASGKLPKDWKSSLVVPIPKKDDHSNPSNYHPISFLPVLSKVLERHMSNLLYDHIVVHSPISTSQWGFYQAGQPQMQFCLPHMNTHEGTKLLTAALRFVPSSLTSRRHSTTCPLLPYYTKLSQLSISDFHIRKYVIFCLNSHHFIRTFIV